MLPPLELALPPTLGRRLLDAEAMGRLETPAHVDVEAWAWQHGWEIEEVAGVGVGHWRTPVGWHERSDGWRRRA